MTADLAAFLSARWDELEAKRGHSHTIPSEADCPCGERGWVELCGSSAGPGVHITHNRGWTPTVDSLGYVTDGSPRTETHILTGDEARAFINAQPLSDEALFVLADLAAKRQIVTQAKFWIKESDYFADHPDSPNGPQDLVGMHGRATAFESVLELLAQPYADHPDFDPAWRTPEER